MDGLETMGAMFGVWMIREEKKVGKEVAKYVFCKTIGIRGYIIDQS